MDENGWPVNLPECLPGDFNREMLFNFHLRLYDDACKIRNAFWENITLDGWQREKTRLSNLFLKMFGPFPKKCDLNERITKSFKRDGYRVENVMYDSVPGMPITANCYIPDHVNGKAPGIVLACGHAQAGKAYARYQLAAIDLVRSGMVVLCFDPISQGERVQLWDHIKRRMIAAFEHNVLDMAATLVGKSIAGQFVWDCIRSIDYLASRPEVDIKRIGMTGCSGGGTQTTWTVSVDERISAAVPICFITSIRERLLSREPADAEQNPPGMLMEGLGYEDFLAMMAPKPLLIAAAKEDFFPIQGARDTVKKLSWLYALSGNSDRIELYEGKGHHGLSDEIRLAMCEWFRRWFNLPAPLKYREAEPETEIQLQVTKTGQLASDGTTVNYYSALKKQFVCLKADKPDKNDIYKVLGIPGEKHVPEMTVVFSESFKKVSISCMRFEPEIGITIPCALFESAGTCRDILVLYSHEDGFSKDTVHGGMIERLVEEGYKVLAFDPRGIGQTRGKSFGWWAKFTEPYLKQLNDAGAIPFNMLGYNDPSYEGPYCTGFEHAETARMLGRPLIGQRIFDVLQTIKAAKRITRLAGCPIVLIGTGTAAMWTLYASYLGQKDSVLKTILYGPLASYSLLMETPNNKWNQQVIAPEILLKGDCPNIIKAMSPAPVMIIDPMGACGTPINSCMAKSIFGDPFLKNLEIRWTHNSLHPVDHILEYLK